MEIILGFTRPLSRGHNELMGEFRMAASDVISIREQVMKYTRINRD